MTAQDQEKGDVEIIGRTQSLWEKVNALGGVDDYSDENWCDDFTPDRYLLTVLTWGGWHETRQEQVELGVLNAYKELASPLREILPLHKLTSEQLQKLSDSYPYKWQKDFLRSIVAYLQRRETTLAEVVESFKKAGPRLALAEMEIILGTESTKIASCFLRDAVKLEVFPIDSRVGDVLERHGLPSDPWAIMAACEHLGIPTRVFARAVYSKAKDL